MIDFSKDEIAAIMQRFGAGFVEKVRDDLITCAGRWSLSSFQLIPSFSANLVLTCVSEDYGHAVLKIGSPAHHVLATEYHALREYGGSRFCRVFDADLNRGVMLEQRVQPGTPLRDEPSLDRRVEVFCSLYEGLHKVPAQVGLYPTYTGWVTGVADRLKGRREFEELYVHMEKAKEIHLSVAAIYTEQKLLHGDFHHDNILLGQDGNYVIIDPKGVIGDPIFDVPRFIVNEFEDEITSDLQRKIGTVLHQLESRLNIPSDILAKCLYVEMTMGACWCAEDGASGDEYERLLEMVRFVEELLNAHLTSGGR